MFGNRQYVQMTYDALTELCAKQPLKSKLSRNGEGHLTLFHQKKDETMGPGRRIVSSEITEELLPRRHEVWYSQAEVGVAGAGWDDPKPWSDTKEKGPLQTQTPDPSGFGG